MSLLFDVSVDSISLYIKNIIKEKELDESVVEESSVTASDGKTIDIQNRMLSYSLNIDRDELSKVINEYTKALDLLDNYNYQTLVPKVIQTRWKS